MSRNELILTSRPVIAKLTDKSAYIVTQLDCSECLSDGLNMTISITSNEEISDKPLGKSICVTYKSTNNTRYYTGIVTSISMTGYNEERRLFLYQVVACDPLSLLEYRQIRRIFQNLTSKEILEEIFKAAEIRPYISFFLKNSGKLHTYCTQINETDRDFVCRLMAMEGWHSHSIHSENTASVKICDSNQAFDEIPEARISCVQRGQHLTNWKVNTALGIATVNLSEYIESNAEIIRSGERQSTEQYSPSVLSKTIYGGGHKSKTDIRTASKLHMESIDSRKRFLSATSKIPAISAGKTFQLIDHPLDNINQKYIIHRVTHTILSDESGRNIQYQNHFYCIPASIPYRLTMLPPPLVHSLHTATVTGPAEEEVYSDKMGRIKVQFHWDQDTNQNENSSCWLPVSQAMASKGFGVQFLPRVGDNVLVQYIEGNPDKPVVVGSLYSQVNSIPYSSTQSGIKTRTTPQGNRKQGNEIRFEDKKNSESILFHAEKDLLLEVNNDVISVVKGKQVTTIDKSAQLSVTEEIIIDGNKTLTATSKQTMIASSNKDIKIEAGTDGKFSAKSKVLLQGETIELLATSKIELKVGSSKIEITGTGIQVNAPKITIVSQGVSELKGTMVNIEGKAKTNIEGALVTVKGSAMTEVKAGAMVNIQGAITKIN